VDNDAFVVVVAVFIPRADEENDQPQKRQSDDPDTPPPVAQMKVRSHQSSRDQRRGKRVNTCVYDELVFARPQIADGIGNPVMVEYCEFSSSTKKERLLLSEPQHLLAPVIMGGGVACEAT